MFLKGTTTTEKLEPFLSPPRTGKRGRFVFHNEAVRQVGQLGTTVGFEVSLCPLGVCPSWCPPCSPFLPESPLLLSPPFMESDILDQAEEGRRP